MLIFKLINEKEIETFIKDSERDGQSVRIVQRQIGTQQIAGLFTNEKTYIKANYTIESPLRDMIALANVYNSIQDFSVDGEFINEGFVPNIAEAAADALPPHEIQIISESMLDKSTIPLDPIAINSEYIKSYVENVTMLLNVINNIEHIHLPEKRLLELFACVIHTTYIVVLEMGYGLLIRKAIEAVNIVEESTKITDFDTAYDVMKGDRERFVFNTKVRNNKTIFRVFDKKTNDYVENPNVKDFNQVLKALLTKVNKK